MLKKGDPSAGNGRTPPSPKEREAKVAELKRLYKSGKYRVDDAEVARKVVEKHVRES